MRLRNIPRADDTLQAHFTVIKNPKEFRGNWTSVFGNDRPIRIEIGMGKGRFLLNMAKTYPNINFIGIERYSSVLLRAARHRFPALIRYLSNTLDQEPISDTKAAHSIGQDRF